MVCGAGELMIRTGLFIMKKMVSSILFHVKVTMTIIHYKGGLSVSVAFTGVVKKVGREKGILFEI